MNRFISRRRLLASAAVALSLQACGGGGGASSSGSTTAPSTVETQAVTRWSSFVLDLMSELEIAGPVEARAFAMAFIAAHDALNAISSRYARYALSTNLNQPTANPDAAVAAAMYAVLDNQLVLTYGSDGSGWKTGFTLTAKRAQLKARYDSELAAITAGNAKSLGVNVGQLAATAILTVRSSDGMSAALSKAYTAQANVGTYQVTPDYAESGITNQTAFAVGWGDVKPFAMGSVAAYALPAPYGASNNANAVLTSTYAADFAEVKAKGALADCGDPKNNPSVCRSADEKDFANFWWENSSTTWLRLAIGVANARSMTDWDKARLYALLEMSMSDASVASLYVKYTYQFWRPITGIRAAADDGNAATAADTAWTGLHTTPPWPDYASVHTACGAAAAAVLMGVIGSDAVSFSATSTTLPGKTRSYASFSGAAVENGLSRIFIGYHFRQAVVDGLTQGNNIGDMTYKTYLTKL